MTVLNAMPTLHVFYNDCDYVAAESAQQALETWAETIGENPDNGYGADEWKQLPDDKVLKGSEEEDDDPSSFVEKTCAEWAAGGRRYLFSSEY